MATGGSDHHAELTVDQSKMQAVLDKADAGIKTPPVEGTIVFRDGRALPVASKEGVVVEPGAAQAVRECRFLHGGSQKIPTAARQPEISDREIDPAELDERFADVADVAVRRGAERRLELGGQATEPAFTAKDAEALKVTERVSRFTTNFPCAEYRNVNLSRAAKLIDGTLLRPGDTFSLKEKFHTDYIAGDNVICGSPPAPEPEPKPQPKPKPKPKPRRGA
jgi:vancomycin resistance protein YoaR